MQRTSLILALMVPLAVATATAQEPDRATQLEALTQVVREADLPATAAAAYARGCAIDANYAPLQDAYMRRMLEFGLPQVAKHAARVLVRMDADNGVAWGVVGYMHALDGQWEQAFAETIRAVELDPDNPSILYNAGELTAWYDNELEVPDVPAWSRRTLERMRDDLMKKQEFARAYEKIDRAYKEQAELGEKFADVIGEAEGDFREAEGIVLEIDRQLRNVRGEIDSARDRIDRLEYEYTIGFVYTANDFVLTPGGYVRYEYPYSIVPPLAGCPLGYRGAVYDDLRRERRHLDDLEVAQRDLQHRGLVAVRELQIKRAALEAARARGRQALERLSGRFRWDPPAINGVVARELEHFPAGPAVEVRLPVDPEAAAASKLQLAQLYLSNGMNEKATEILEEILEDFGTTKAAQDVRRLLLNIPAPAETPE